MDIIPSLLKEELKPGRLIKAFDSAHNSDITGDIRPKSMLERVATTNS
jgi:hypothetical protein